VTIFQNAINVASGSSQVLDTDVTGDGFTNSPTSAP
jgi:hypothetical protein